MIVCNYIYNKLSLCFSVQIFTGCTVV